MQRQINDDNCHGHGHHSGSFETPKTVFGITALMCKVAGKISVTVLRMNSFLKKEGVPAVYTFSKSG